MFDFFRVAGGYLLGLRSGDGKGVLQRLRLLQSRTRKRIQRLIHRHAAKCHHRALALGFVQFDFAHHGIAADVDAGENLFHQSGFRVEPQRPFFRIAAQLQIKLLVLL